MKKVLQRHRMHAAAIAVLAMLISFVGISDYAEAAGSAYVDEYLFIEKAILEGEEVDTYDTVETSRGDVYLNPEDCVVTVSDPEVLTISWQEISYDPGHYRLIATGLKEGTATVNIHCLKKDVYSEDTIEVISKSKVVLKSGPFYASTNISDGTLSKAGTFTLYEYTCYLDGEWLETVSATYMDITSSNPKAVKVYKPEGAKPYLKGVGPGKAVITLTVNHANNKGLNGVSATFNVTVEGGGRATAPVLCDQAASGAYLLHNRLEVNYKLKNQNAIYEIWRSKSPNKNFKRVGRIVVKEDSVMDGYFKVPYLSGSWEGGEKVSFDDYSKKHRLQANTKYYYKMRVKYTDPYFDNSWSKWSKVRTYWTPPKPLADSKIKFNSGSRYVKIPKVKGAKGYIYTYSAVELRGYNVFGQPVYYTAEKTRTTSKRSFKVGTVEGMRPDDVDDVVPYAKHGNYYYAHGYKPVKKLTRYHDWDAHSFVN